MGGELGIRDGEKFTDALQKAAEEQPKKGEPQSRDGHRPMGVISDEPSLAEQRKKQDVEEILEIIETSPLAQEIKRLLENSAKNPGTVKPKQVKLYGYTFPKELGFNPGEDDPTSRLMAEVYGQRVTKQFVEKVLRRSPGGASVFVPFGRGPREGMEHGVIAMSREGDRREAGLAMAAVRGKLRKQPRIQEAKVREYTTMEFADTIRAALNDEDLVAVVVRPTPYEKYEVAIYRNGTNIRLLAGKILGKLPSGAGAQRPESSVENLRTLAKAARNWWDLEEYERNQAIQLAEGILGGLNRGTQNTPEGVQAIAEAIMGLGKRQTEKS